MLNEINERIQAASLFELPEMEASPRYYAENGVMIIELRGPVLRGVPEVFRAYFDWIDPDEITEVINAVQDREEIRMIAFLVDSPGGTIGGVNELADAINKSVKPTVAIIDGMAASAAYWIASAANVITASKTSLIGSIGVFIEVVDDYKFYSDQGVVIRTIASSELKTFSDENGSQISKNQIDSMRREVMALYEIFKSTVAGNREMSPDQIADASTGEVWLGDEAKRKNLVDDVMPPLEVLQKILQGVVK